MRVLSRRLKGNSGEITLLPENLDDLWHLKYIIEKGDLVFALTKRTLEEASDKIRPDKAEKKPVRLGVRVEKVEYHRYANRLRVHGIIEHGTGQGNYHTLNIDTGKELSIIKEEWKREQLTRIEDAVKASKQPKIIIVTIEEGEASIGILRQFGVEQHSTITMSYGKREGNYREEFLGEVLSQMKNLPFEFAIVAGPGFTKEDFFRFLKDKDAEMALKVIMEDSSSIGTSGFLEVLKRGAVERLAKDIRIAHEARFVDKLMEEIGKERKAVYGIDAVKRAHTYGAIETLLVVDEYLRKERETWDIDTLLFEVERAGGKVVIMSGEFEPGKRVMALGGIAAILRFRI